MKYVSIRQFGGPEVLELAERETPAAGPAQVLIKVEAAGVNRPDVMQRQGKYPPPAGASDIPGLEIAGVVVQVGENVESPNIGDKICALITGGGYAEYAVADAALCLPIPAGLSAVEAAAIPETYFTVWSNVFDRAKLKPGESFLVHGGSSGIGTTAIQLAKAFGAKVFATAGNDDKCAACRKLGADLAINYQQDDFVSACKAATNNNGVDVILDMVAGDYISRNIALAAEDGRIVMIAGLHGYSADINFLPVILKRLSITGSGLRLRSVSFKADLALKLKQYVWPLIESGKVRPVIQQTLPLQQAAEAHRIMEASQHIGKIVLTI